MTFTEVPDKINPAYSIANFTVWDQTREASVGLYYQFDISIGGDLVHIKQTPDITKKAQLNVATIIQQYVQSTVITHPSLMLDFSTGLIPYTIKAYSVVGLDLRSADSSTHYVFNAVDQYYRTWDLSTYLFTANTGKFLTDWESNDIHFGDDLYVQYINGNFGPFDSSIKNIKVTKYKPTGTDVSTFAIAIATTPTIVSLNIGTISLNISNQYTRYTVDASGLVNPIEINITADDDRFNYHRFYWVNSYGATDSFNFDLAETNNISIGREVYKNNYLNTTYNTTVEDNYTVTSNWICEAASLNLKTLWHSPKAYLYSGYLIPIIIRESSKQILLRKNVGLINYTFAYTFAEDYLTQKF